MQGLAVLSDLLLVDVHYLLAHRHPALALDCGAHPANCTLPGGVLVLVGHTHKDVSVLLLKRMILPPCPMCLGSCFTPGGILLFLTPRVVYELLHQVFFKLSLCEDMLIIPVGVGICQVSIRHAGAKHGVPKSHPPVPGAGRLLHRPQTHSVRIPSIDLVELRSIDGMHLGLGKGPFFEDVVALHQLALGTPA